MQRIVIPKTCRALPFRRMQSTESTALLMQCEGPLSRKRTTHSQHTHHPHPTSCKAFLPTGCTLSSESTPSTSSLTTCTSLPPQQHAKHSRPHSMQRIVISKTCRALPSRRMQRTELTVLLMQCERPLSRRRTITQAYHTFTAHTPPSPDIMQSILADRMYTLIRKHAKHFLPHNMHATPTSAACKALSPPQHAKDCHPEDAQSTTIPTHAKH
eukprot:Blabericola_migrator_1__6129@NODE_3096_length_2038_cov_22_542364_g1938_i0_p1_GENE_NODE_3096_length_2038_cov_22_542364_g1938_i0NODE_3096_length_2038_cov_22_542364_g1938_i0_p1_ORF_typecomplete_len213_score14_64_NODE_3096_length_2038_cov_22_542364_g1938_i0161799